MEKHWTKQGAAFTKEFLPIQVISVILLETTDVKKAEEYEDILTIKKMRTDGIINVRGGHFPEVKKADAIKALEHYGWEVVNNTAINPLNPENKEKFSVLERELGSFKDIATDFVDRDLLYTKMKEGRKNTCDFCGYKLFKLRITNDFMCKNKECNNVISRRQYNIYQNKKPYRSANCGNCGYDKLFYEETSSPSIARRIIASPDSDYDVDISIFCPDCNYISYNSIKKSYH